MAVLSIPFILVFDRVELQIWDPFEVPVSQTWDLASQILVLVLSFPFMLISNRV